MNADLEAITQQMQRYFDGLYHSDTGRLRNVFHKDARYVCPVETDLVNLGMNEYFAIVDKREAPAARGEARRDSIVSISFAGTTCAIVRAHCTIGPRFFTDLLTFIKAEGEWRIIAKVFHYDVAQAAA